MSASVEYSTKESYSIILKNTLLMCKRRGLISNIDDVYNKYQDDFINKNIIEFEALNKSKLSINIFNGKIISIVQGSQLDEYLKKNVDVHKILIMKFPSKRSVKQIINEYVNAEFFFEHEMMEDIPSKLFIPEHILLSESERTDFFTQFKESDIAKMNNTDIMCRHYNAKIGDVFKIIRPSLSAGKNIFYRRVVLGNLEQIFG